MAERVILAYSGGLDTSVAIPYLHDKTGAEVVAVVLAPVGKGEVLGAIGAGVEHDALFSVPVDAVAFQRRPLM